MIDALLYAVRDGIRASAGYDHATCEIMDDGRPPPRAGEFFVSVHDGAMTCNTDNNLDERYSFSLTLTMRVTVPVDRVGDQQMARNIARIPLGERQGFYARTDRLRRLVHMNWQMTVMTGQTPSSANDNIVAWSDTTVTGPRVYGFVEPMRFMSMEAPKLVGGEWFAADPEVEEFGMKATLRFGRARRLQPQTEPVGPFI